MTIQQKAKAAESKGPSGGGNFNPQNNVVPPKTLLNLTVNMLDALSVEFALVQDPMLFKAFKIKHFGEDRNSDQCPGESWGGEDHHHASQ